MSGTWGSPNVQPWRDDFKGRQQPAPKPVDDLSKFVLARISATEDAPQFDVPQAYNQPAGPIAHRYAAEMRRDMVAFRVIVAAYCKWNLEREDARANKAGDLWIAHHEGLRFAVAAIAIRFADHPDFRDEWRLE